MAAISTVLQFLCPGDTLVVNKDIYGCSYKLFQRIAASLRLTLIFLDLSVAENLSGIPSGTRMVFFETPTNPFLKTVHISEVGLASKRANPNSLVVVDNTWATPLFQHPLELGADISLHSGTKYFSGHSDVMGGILLMDRSDLHEQVRSARFYSGTVLDPHSAWLLRRSMQTFHLRMKEHSAAAASIKEFLGAFPQVARVYYPEVDGRQLTGYGGLLFFQLRPDLTDQYTQFRDSLTLFDTGTGMACVTSMVAQPYTGSHASMTPFEKTDIALDEGLVRLNIGLEDLDDLKEDLTNAFASLEQERTHSAA
jgi:cystathionine beta-lyase/cystathionine gamma-synthase